ncbi:MAG: amino acid adenylation domain-containing protein [Methanobrevibacter thaueri]|uniref:non-ribosomal peptide synthetase n=1 Tax=Methanobrevibacter thaueri TaxID=190975 RepID=UPI0026ECD511|nr:non-ribosomal peptide synthetase [Methanobrevibacter thaueri]MBE6495353.1 amino acid adenylation domain-containing protein [Methanobrevibacter thaueri]
MHKFNLSSSQKMLLFSEINNPNNDSFYLKFRKDYDLKNFDKVKQAIESISRNHLNLKIKYDEKGDFKQYYDDFDVNVESFEVADENLDQFIVDYLDEPFDDVFDSPLYKWAVLKTESSAVLIGVVQHILLDGTSLFSLIPQEIEKYLRDGDYVSDEYSYETYVNDEMEYLKSPEASEDKKYWLNILKDYSQDWYSFDNSELGYYEVLLDQIPNFKYSPFVTALALEFLYFAKSKKSNKLFKDIVMNTSVHGRYFGQGDALGMFVNTIPLRLTYDEDLTFDELMVYSKSVLKEGLAHAKLQFSEYATDLRNVNIDPDCISMFSIVSNSTDYDSKFLTLQKDIKFPLHFRINKNYSDKNGLQSIFVEYDKSCFSHREIESIANGLRDLLRQIMDDSSKKCKDYTVEVVDFFNAENYYNNMMNSFDNPTAISPDMSGDNVIFSELSKPIDDDKLKNLSKQYNLSKERMLLSVFMFNLTKFSFSKDILVAYNKQACGYHFNTDLSVIEYLEDFKKYFKYYSNYPLLNNKKLNFESEILFFTDEYDAKDYKFVFNYESGKINISYDESFYSKELIETFLESMEVLLDRFESGDNLLKDISIRRQLEYDEDFKIELANEGVVNKVFDMAVAQNPQKTILIAEDGEVTYGELDKKANRIANALIKRGVNIEDRVMFMMRRNSDLIAAVLGIVKAGAAFIPIDPKYPKNRINQILDDSDSKFVITSSEIGYDGENRIDIDDLLDEIDDSNPEIELTPDNLCFMIYTSGSTGKPKGVMITHRGITNYVANVEENVPIYELNHKCNKFISISTVSFIVFLREVFGTILNGLPVVFANDEESIDPLKLVELFKKTGAQGFGSTPTRLLEYIQLEEIQDVVKDCTVIIVGGEGFPPILYERLSKYTDADIYNSYGPTEVTIASHYKLIDSSQVTAGWKMLNVVDKIMDIDGNQLPPYVMGEIYVGGAGIARGYLNNEEQTQKVFLTLNDIPYYNTGDLGKKDANGELYVHGRNDTQIKLRGLRIELSEIEGAIANYDGISLSKVVVKKVNSVEHLCAYFTAVTDIDIDDLKQHLVDSIPEYMVPSYFTQLDEFPKTPNGKTDFKNLPDPEIDVDDFIKPRNEIEQELFNIVSELLNIEEFGVNTDLFSIGLTSLSVIKLTSAIYNNLNAQLNVTEILNYKTIERIASEIKIDDASSSDVQELYPLTSNQLGVYFDCIKDPENTAYNLPKKMEFSEGIDADKLKLSIIESIENHPYLKTRIVMENGEVYQQRRDNLKVDDLIEMVDDANVDEFVKPFKLDEGPLFRFKIVGNSMLLADFHHIIVDGTSLNILFDEIAKIYDGKDYEIEEIDGFEYSLNEKKTEQSSLYEEAKLFFSNKVKEFDDATLIPQDINGDESEGSAAMDDIFLGKESIDEFCAKSGISQNNLFLAATSFVINKFVYNREILIATITNGRFNPNQQKTLAMMVKTLPLSLKLNSDSNIKEYLDYINGEWLNVLGYSSYPLTEISNEFDITPEILYAYHGKIIEDIEIGGMNVERQSIDYEGLKFKININVVDVGDQYRIFCEYNDQLYSKTLIDTFLNCIRIVLNKFQSFDEKTLMKDISIIENDDWGVDDLEYDEIPEERLNKIFENQVEMHPDRVVLYATDGEFTYEQLNEKANRIAHGLIKRGVGPEDRIMFILNRDSNTIASIFGILKSGAAFIPVDSEYPSERIEHVLTDSESKYIIVDDVIEKKSIDLSQYEDNLLDVHELLKEEDTSNPDPDVHANNMAYLIYTSGSTGLPKGVILEHGNIANFVYPDPRNVCTYELVHNLEKEDYKVLSTTTVAFDVFQQEIMGSLLNGVPMVFANDTEYKDPIEMMSLIHRTGANVYIATPSRLLQYLEIEAMQETMYGFKVYIHAGEPFSARLYELLSQNSNGKLFNMYGPTETTVYCNGQLLESSDIHIGKELFNVHEMVMDFDSNPLPPNVIGEMYIAGKGVSREYLNRPEKNEESYEIINGIRFYHSGDFVKVTEDGNYYVFGRMDNQIKLRGLRIEIGEIEVGLSNFPGIKSVAVVVKKIKGNDHLCAYFTVHDDYKDENREENGYSIDIDELKASLAEKLVYYMVPTVYMELDEMPQTVNGKTDLRNLPEPVLITEYVAPENEIEAFFANLFAEILGLDEVSATDNFFEIGGTSLLVTKITMEAINRNYNLNYGDVFSNPTPRALSDFILSDESLEKKSEMAYDYSQINSLLEKNNLETIINGEIQDSVGNVLLTGATGFLGIHVLRELLENEDGEIYCFIRSNKVLSGAERLKSLLFYYFSDEYNEAFDERLHIIEGDITNFEDFEKLVHEKIDTVFNCAANVKHFSSGTDIEDINLGGVVNGLKFAKMKNAKYVQISTYSIAGESIDNYPPVDVKFTENDLFIGQAVDNQYLNSKFLAERAVLEAAVNDDLDVKIMRVGNLMARSSDSEFQINFVTNGFINRLKAFVTIGKMPYSMLMNPVEFSPIDITAKAIVGLSKTPKECTIFHPYDYHNISFGDIIDIIRPLGLTIDPAEDDDYQKALDEALADKTKQEGVSGLITSIGSGKVKKIWLPVDNSYTIQALYRLGITWPFLSEEYVYNFVKYLDELDFFSV